MAEDTDSAAQPFRLTSIDGVASTGQPRRCSLDGVGPIGVSPELQVKLERQLNKIAQVEDLPLSTSQMCSGNNTDRPGDCPEETVVTSDGEVSDEASDADSEPLEYAMLSVASKLDAKETAALFDKVKRHEASRTRREQGLRNRVAKTEAEAKQVVAEKEAEAMAAKEALAARETECSDGPWSPERRPSSERPGSEGSPSRGASEPCLERPAPVGRSGCSCGSCCCCFFLLLLAPLLCTSALFAHGDRESVRLAMSQAHDFLEQHVLQLESLQHTVCDASALSTSAGAETGIDEDVLGVAERLRCARLVAQARRERLAVLAKGVVLSIAIAAGFSLLLAVAYWKYIIGLVVAVLAGAVIFVVAVVAVDAAPIGI